MLHESWRWLAYIGGWWIQAIVFLKALDNVWTKWTWVERKLNDLSFFWHSGPEPFAKDLTIWVLLDSWDFGMRSFIFVLLIELLPDDYDPNGPFCNKLAMNLPMMVSPRHEASRHRMSRFDPPGSFFCRVESWDRTSVERYEKNTCGPLRILPKNNPHQLLCRSNPNWLPFF